MHFASSLRKGGTANTLKAIRDLSEFDAANLHGSTSTFEVGRLKRVWRDDFEADRRRRRILYVIRSWSTPLAWFVEGEGWVYPPVGYTSYTSRQQALVRHAIAGERTIPRREHLNITIDWEWETAA